MFVSKWSEKDFCWIRPPPGFIVSQPNVMYFQTANPKLNSCLDQGHVVFMQLYATKGSQLDRQQMVNAKEEPYKAKRDRLSPYPTLSGLRVSLVQAYVGWLL